MVTVDFSIPQMDNLPTAIPEVYLWFAYFWADMHAISNPPNVAVFVPPLHDSRSVNQDASPDSAGGIAIPIEVGTLQVNLDDGGAGIGGAGVLIALFEKHGTPDDAISAGYDAFGPALQQQLNLFLKQNGFVAPNDQQINTIAKSVSDAVTSAVSSKLSLWDKLFGTQDSFQGYSTVLIAGPEQLKVGTGGGIPNIKNDPPNRYGQCNFPGGNILVVNPPSDPCASQAAAVQAAITTVRDLNDLIQNLELQLETANHLQRQQLQMEIKATQKQLSAAQAELAKAQKTLQLCRARQLPRPVVFNPA